MPHQEPVFWQPLLESGAWLNALPISSLGLRMDNNTIRVAVGLRLGSSLCRPHTCHHCGTKVGCLATHGLSCRWSEGRHHHNATVNDIICRALSSARVPSRLEPPGLFRLDGKRPDGVSVVPWKNGKLLVWDAQTPSHPPTLPLPPAKPGPWLPRLRRGNASSIATWPPATSLYQWPSKLQAPLDLGPESFSQNWASVSGRSQERSDLEPTSSSAYRLPSRGEMRHPFWAPSATVWTLRTLSSLFIGLFLFSFIPLFCLFFCCCFLFCCCCALLCLVLLTKNIFYFFIFYLFIYFTCLLTVYCFAMYFEMQ